MSSALIASCAPGRAASVFHPWLGISRSLAVTWGVAVVSILLLYPLPLAIFFSADLTGSPWSASSGSGKSGAICVGAVSSSQRMLRSSSGSFFATASSTGAAIWSKPPGFPHGRGQRRDAISCRRGISCCIVGGLVNSGVHDLVLDVFPFAGQYVKTKSFFDVSRTSGQTSLVL